MAAPQNIRERTLITGDRHALCNSSAVDLATPTVLTAFLSPPPSHP
jgi:hypothetical protein